VTPPRRAWADPRSVPGEYGAGVSPGRSQSGRMLTVIVTRAEIEHEGPAIGAFPGLLEAAGNARALRPASCAGCGIS
jgi:hypothetical protein